MMIHTRSLVWKGLLYVLVVLALLIPSAVADQEDPEISESAKGEILGRITQILENKAYAYQTDFSQWRGIIDEHKDALAEADTEKTFSQAVQRCLDEFKISHLSLQSPSRKEEQKSGTVRNLVGIFMTEEDGEFLVSRIVRDSPAYEAGIRRGDTVVSIDGTLIKDRPEPVEGATSKRVKWKRGDQQFEKEIAIKEHPSDEPVFLSWVDDDIAVVTVMSFGGKYYKMGAVNRIMREAKKARGMILDMRGNYGGFVHLYLHLASHFSSAKEPFHLRVGKRQYGRITNGEGAEEKSRVEILAEGTRGRPWGLPKKRYAGPVVIIVDRHCASGGELFPAAMRDLEKAVVIGTQTMGALLGSRSARLPHGFQLSYPVFEMSPPSGKRIEGTGLVPDIVLTARETATDAIVFEKAIDVIENWPL